MTYSSLSKIAGGWEDSKLDLLAAPVGPLADTTLRCYTEREREAKEQYLNITENK